MPKYREGKQTQPIELEEMREVLGSSRFKRQSHRTYLAILYLTGVRVSEVLSLTKESFTEDPGSLTVNFPPVKRGLPHTCKLARDVPFVGMIAEQVSRTRGGGRVWGFTRVTANSAVKRAMGEKYYNHFLRLNRNVHFLDDPESTLPEIQSWFGVKKVSDWVNSYMGFSQRHIDRQAERLRKNI